MGSHSSIHETLTFDSSSWKQTLNATRFHLGNVLNIWLEPPKETSGPHLAPQVDAFRTWHSARARRRTPVPLGRAATQSHAALVHAERSWLRPLRTPVRSSPFPSRVRWLWEPVGGVPQLSCPPRPRGPQAFPVPFLRPHRLWERLGPDGDRDRLVTLWSSGPSTGGAQSLPPWSHRPSPRTGSAGGLPGTSAGRASEVRLSPPSSRRSVPH